MSKLRSRLVLGVLCAALGIRAQAAPRTVPDPTFTIAVIPDTQNYIDFTHQRSEGFPIDGREIFFDQLAFVARNAQSQGGDIVFATALGDVWQHLASDQPDPEHARLGLRAVASNLTGAFAGERFAGPLHNFEVPAALRGYDMLSGKLPFSVVPGNHDYDAFWFDSRFPPDPKARIEVGRHPSSGRAHIGGLTLFQQAFGSQSRFFAGKPWYVGAFRHGADSAQMFEAGGYCFLHIGLEMQPDQSAINWAISVMKSHSGSPTIISIHQYLNVDANRDIEPILNLSMVHPEHTDPQALWDRLISQNRQIFLVLNGHQDGAARRIDKNVAGEPVYQLLSDYQARGQSARIARSDGGAGIGVPGVGDGWLRLMQFSLTQGNESVRVRTYSTFFKAFANEVENYAAWYKPVEHPHMTDAEFLAQDEFQLNLTGFANRFRPGRCNGE